MRNGRGSGPRNVRPRDPFTLLETIRDPKPMDMWVIAISIYCIRNSSRDVCKAQEDTSAHAFGHHGDAAACHGSHRRATLQAGRLRVRANTVLTSDPQEGCAFPPPPGVLVQTRRTSGRWEGAESPASCRKLRTCGRTLTLFAALAAGKGRGLKNDIYKETSCSTTTTPSLPLAASEERPQRCPNLNPQEPVNTLGARG